MLETVGEGWRRDVVEEAVEPALERALTFEVKQSEQVAGPVGRPDGPSFAGR